MASILQPQLVILSDIDHDGIDELVMHNDKVFMVFEENWW